LHLRAAAPGIEKSSCTYKSSLQYVSSIGTCTVAAVGLVWLVAHAGRHETD
jgi:hypothetical protein